MVGYIKRAYAQTQLIVVGFSLGGNIVCKFLGENMMNQERVLCCVSVCQGYSALRWAPLLFSHLSIRICSACVRRCALTLLKMDEAVHYVIRLHGGLSVRVIYGLMLFRVMRHTFQLLF